ncbi:Ni/Fe-hydrogenase cytochrome b subunit [Sulfuricaulis sp.]|jgi:Ni/Fe-hydrogenase subunit HybB-like protein|uniref:Ni/Fe-hydrogenase cytochrome b subunit n=1 Tax=Sulfuricaulis sp. TaxID=2003553 RepID=UPI00355A5909
MSAHEPLGGRILTKPFLALSALAAIALVIILARFVFGLGAVTHINDGYPWGIWIVVDVMIGTAFGCAGYAIALVVYVLNRGEYHPLVRPAMMAGLFGYALAGAAVIVDLGRYWQMYTLFLPWYVQTNSVMLEVAWCVMAYVVVLAIEFSPAVLERFGLVDARKKLSKVLFFFIAVGVLLPTMHQSSLGTMIVVLGYKLSPLWQTQLLPLEFLVTAILMGFAIVPFEAILAARGFRRPIETRILGKLSSFTALLLAAYLVIRFADIIVRGQLGAAFTISLEAGMFWLENALFVLALAMLARPAYRTNPRMIFIAAVVLLVAGSIYRINAYLIGYHPAAGWNYFPSVTEILVTVGMFSIEILLYLLFVKQLPVLPRHERVTAVQ